MWPLGFFHITCMLAMFRIVIWWSIVTRAVSLEPEHWTAQQSISCADECWEVQLKESAAFQFDTVDKQTDASILYTHQGFAHLANPLEFYMDASVSAMPLPAAYANAKAIHADTDAIDHDNATEGRLHISWNSKVVAEPGLYLSSCVGVADRSPRKLLRYK